MEFPQACERKIGSDKKGSTSVNKQTLCARNRRSIFAADNDAVATSAAFATALE
jgi:hypothetical protein